MTEPILNLELLDKLAWINLVNSLPLFSGNCLQITDYEKIILEPNNGDTKIKVKNATIVINGGEKKINIFLYKYAGQPIIRTDTSKLADLRITLGLNEG